MTTPTMLVDAMLSAIKSAVADIDTVSSSDFSPAITTAKVAALSPAFDLEQSFTWQSLSSDNVLITHRIPIELWVKHDGNPATTMQRARDIGVSVIDALIAADGTGFTMIYDDPVLFSVDPALTTINSVSWLVATMIVSLYELRSI